MKKILSIFAVIIGLNGCCVGVHDYYDTEYRYVTDIDNVYTYRRVYSPIIVTSFWHKYRARPIYLNKSRNHHRPSHFNRPSNHHRPEHNRIPREHNGHRGRR